MDKRRYKPKKVQFFDWTPDLAYAVGLITTDGCLSPDGRHITFTSIDIEQIGHIKLIFNSSCKIGFSKNARSEAYRITLSNVQLYDWLIRIGLMPNKSLKLGSLKIPDQFFIDFLRGHLDGDGSITCYTDKWNAFKNPKYIYNRIWLRFISASESHMIWMQNKTIDLTGIRGRLHVTNPKPGKNPMYIFKFGKKESVSLLSKIYYSATIFCLSRKRKIYEAYIEKTT